MNKTNWFYGQNVGTEDIQNLMTEIESADQNIAKEMIGYGVVSGLEVSEPDPVGLTLKLSSGVARDQNGRRIEVPSTQTLDFTDAVPNEYSRYVSVVLKFARNNYDARVDGKGDTVYYRSDEYYEISLKEGTKAVSPETPTLDSDEVLIADVFLTAEQTEITLNDVDLSSRKEYSSDFNAGTVGGYEMDLDEGSDDEILSLNRTNKKLQSTGILLTEFQTKKQVAITEDTTIENAEYGREITATVPDDADLTLTLPDPANNSGLELIIIRSGSSDYKLILESIANILHFNWEQNWWDVLYDNEGVRLVSDGTNWRIRDLIGLPSFPGNRFWHYQDTAPSYAAVIDGSAVDRTRFRRVYYRYDLDEGITLPFGAGDGSTTFNLPDEVGYFLRGYDALAEVDTSGRAFGDLQDDAMQRITGHLEAGRFLNNTTTPDNMTGVFSRGTSAELEGSGAGGTTDSTTQSVDFDSADSVSPNSAKTDDYETRPKNIALLPCMVL